MSQDRPVPKRNFTRDNPQIFKCVIKLWEEFKIGKKHLREVVDILHNRSKTLAQSQSDQRALVMSYNQKQDKDVADLRAETAGLATIVANLVQNQKVHESSDSGHNQSQSTHRQTDRTPKRSSGSQGSQRVTKCSSRQRKSRIVPPTTRALRSANRVWVRLRYS